MGKGAETCVLYTIPLSHDHPLPFLSLPPCRLLVLGLFGFSNSLALFWLLVIVFLQRGPVVPCENELSPLADSSSTRTAAIVALLLPLLVLLPYPVTGGGSPDLPTF